VTVLKFEMSGRQFTFDGDLEVTADELWALDELRVDATEIVAALGGGDRPPPERVTRVFCALAYLCARRENPATTWAQFSRTIAPGTLNVHGVEPSGLGAALLEGKPPPGSAAPEAKKTEAGVS